MSHGLVLKPYTLMGTSEESVRFTLENGPEVDVGPLTVTLDHLSGDGQNNFGEVDLATGQFQARFAVQITAPGLYDLVVAAGMSPTAAGPIRATTFWEGRYTEHGTLEATGEVEVLPGSIWEGTTAHTNCTGT
jgi:hypothetical protein